MKDLELKYCIVENREKQNPAKCPHFNFNNHPGFKMFTGDTTEGYIFCNKADRVIEEVKIDEVLEKMRNIPDSTETKDSLEKFVEKLFKVIGDVEAPKWCPLKKK
jgi:hypothetical protein